jgi:hypothetical protein
LRLLPVLLPIHVLARLRVRRPIGCRGDRAPHGRGGLLLCGNPGRPVVLLHAMRSGLGGPWRWVHGTALPRVLRVMRARGRPSHELLRPRPAVRDQDSSMGVLLLLLPSRGREREARKQAALRQRHRHRRAPRRRSTALPPAARLAFQGIPG